MLVVLPVRVYYFSVRYKCFKIDFRQGIYVVQQLKKKSWRYDFPYFDIFIFSEWRDTGVSVATWEENNMATQKRKFQNADIFSAILIIIGFQRKDS